jgi:thiol-disulfide isomerase/thioredoxin
MTETAPHTPRKGPPRRVVTAAAIGAAVVVALGVGVFNFTRAPATECPIQAEAARAIDAAATGELAALNGTGGGRGYSAMAFEDGAGKPLTVAAFAGKKLLVNFWASWCIPCREEMPELDRLAAKYNGAGFQVLPIDLDVGDDGIAKAKAFLSKGNWANLPLYADPTLKAFDTLKTTGVSLGLPTSLLLDAKGCELGVLQGPAKWDTSDGYRVIEALLGV